MDCNEKEKKSYLKKKKKLGGALICKFSASQTQEIFDIKKKNNLKNYGFSNSKHQTCSKNPCNVINFF